MDLQPLTSNPIQAPNTRLGVIIRVVFFAAMVIVGLQLMPLVLYGLLGEVVAGTIGLFLTGLIANLLTMRIFDRRPIADIGLGTGHGASRNFALGVLLGGGSAALMLVAPLLEGTGHLVVRQNSSFSWASLVIYLGCLLFGAAGEEMMFRGYAFQLLVQKLGPFATVLPVGVLFGFAHMTNPNATKLSVLNTVLWGILLGYSFLRSRDLWLPIGLHYSWNAVLPLFGVNLSGLTIDVTRFSYQWDLAPLWSGGAYGPEGGLLATLFVIALFFVLAKTPIAPQVAAIATVLNEPV